MNQVVHTLKEKLFGYKESKKIYAIIDSAVDDTIDGHFESDEPHKEILYRDEEDRVDLELKAPHLIAMEEDHPFTERIFQEGHGNYWGCFIVSSVTFETLAEHLKAYTKIYSQEHKQDVYIRFYDPRAMGQYFSLFDDDEAEAFFSKIDEIWVENPKDSNIVYSYSLHQVSLKIQKKEIILMSQKEDIE